MPTVGRGVEEIRVHAGREYRVVYVARFEEAVYVLHAFEKKSRRTPTRAIDVARQRLQRLIAERHRGGAGA